MSADIHRTDLAGSDGISAADAEEAVPTKTTALLGTGSSAVNKVQEIRLFVSSTFKDMSVEREQLVKTVFPELKQLCQERGVFFSYVDLRWGITEQESQDGQTLNLCLGEIDRCRPFFICMMGERYGWHQPSGAAEDATLAKTFKNASESYAWTQNYRDRSITELEIRHAILNSVAANDLTAVQCMRCAFYMRDPRAAFLHELPEGAAVARSESGEALAKLNSLKSEIRSAKLYTREYKNQTQFARTWLIGSCWCCWIVFLSWPLMLLCLS